MLLHRSVPAVKTETSTHCFAVLNLSAAINGLLLNCPTEYPRLSDEYARLSNEYERVSNEYPGLTDEYLRLADKYERVSNEYPGLTDEYLRLADKYERVSNEYPGLTDEYPRLANEYERVSSEYPGLTDEYPRLSDKCSRLDKVLPTDNHLPHEGTNRQHCQMLRQKTEQRLTGNFLGEYDAEPERENQRNALQKGNYSGVCNGDR